MKGRWTAGTTAFALIAVALAQAPTQAPYLRDRKGDFAIFGVDSAVADDLTGPAPTIEVLGDPVNGFSRGQGLTFQMDRLNATLSREGQALFLRTAQARGDVLFVVDRGNGRSEFRGPALDLRDGAETAEVTVPQPFRLLNQTGSDRASRTIELKASRGEFTLAPLRRPGPEPLRAATVMGGVDVTVTTVETTPAGPRRTVFRGTGDRLTYSAETRTMVMSGNVVYTGVETPAEGAGFDGEMRVSEMTVVFDQDFQVSRISTRQGAGTFRETGAGGGP